MNAVLPFAAAAINADSTPHNTSESWFAGLIDTIDLTIIGWDSIMATGSMHSNSAKLGTLVGV